MKYQYLTKNEQKINRRYFKLIVQSVHWNKKSLGLFKELNDNILQMQDFVRNKMLAVNKEFLKLQNEFSFLKGFQVIGQIEFSKTLLDDDSDEEIRALWPANRRKEYDLWTMLTDYTDSKVWQLTFDSIAQDFTPYSKDLLKKSDYNSWYTGLSEDDGVQVASYLNSLVRMNQSITYKDLQKCTIEDFYPFVFVTVNFDEPEIVGFRNYRINIPEDIEAMCVERQRLHNRHFQWSEDNIERILQVNEVLNRKSAFMKESITKLHSRFKELGKKNSLFEYFDIDAEIQYQNKTHPTEVADMKLLRILQDNTSFSTYSIRCNEETERITDHWHDGIHNEKINWNFEVYKNHLSEEQQKIPFNYFMHGVFVDGRTYSFEDLICMNEEDFVICWDINVNNIN